MCAACEILGLRKNTHVPSYEERHQLIDLQTNMLQLLIKLAPIDHRLTSLDQRSATELAKSSPDIIELARLKRNRSAAQLDRDNLYLQVARVMDQIDKIKEPKQTPEEEIGDLLGDAGFMEINPDDPRYAGLLDLISAISGSMPGFAFGQPMMGGPAPFGPTEMRNGSQRMRGGFGFPSAPSSPA